MLRSSESETESLIPIDTNCATQPGTFSLNAASMEIALRTIACERTQRMQKICTNRSHNVIPSVILRVILNVIHILKQLSNTHNYHPFDRGQRHS